MSDSEVTSAVSMRKKLKRIRQQVQDIKEQVADQRAEENAAAIDYDMVQEMQDQIDIYKDNHTHFSESLYEMEVHQKTILSQNSSETIIVLQSLTVSVYCLPELS